MSHPLRNRIIPRWLHIAYGAFALVGFADATYLFLEHLAGSAPNCSFLSGCQVVATSEYATIGPIPIAALGMAYYLVLLVITLRMLEKPSVRGIRLLGMIPIAGLIASLVLVYLQIFVIDAICIYCMISALSSIVLFMIGLGILRALAQYGRAELYSNNSWDESEGQTE